MFSSSLGIPHSPLSSLPPLFSNSLPVFFLISQYLSHDFSIFLSVDSLFIFLLTLAFLLHCFPESSFSFHPSSSRAFSLSLYHDLLPSLTPNLSNTTLYFSSSRSLFLHLSLKFLGSYSSTVSPNFSPNFHCSHLNPSFRSFATLPC